MNIRKPSNSPLPNRPTFSVFVRCPGWTRVSNPSALPIDAAVRCKIPVTIASAIPVLPAARHRFPYGHFERATGDQLIHRRTWHLLQLVVRRRWPPEVRGSFHPGSSTSTHRSRVWPSLGHWLPWQKGWKEIEQ